MQNLRSEAEIINDWKDDDRTPLVNVMCLTYNHEKYIEDALQGFLIQKTDFPFEVLIHEDASTDKTAEIIRKYEKLYPNIIKPVYQTENQWTKDKEVIRKAQYDRVKGKYLAYCEGDDYWTDPYKLQKQVDLMENDEDISLSFSNALIKNIDGTMHLYKKKVSKLFFSTEDIIKEYFILTATIMLRTKYTIKKNQRFKNVVNADWLKQLLCSSYGKIACINHPMTVYRQHELSLSRMIRKDPWQRYNNLALMFDTFDKFTANKYHSLIEEKKRMIYKETKNDEFKMKYFILFYVIHPRVTVIKVLKKILRVLDYEL